MPYIPERRPDQPGGEKQLKKAKQGKLRLLLIVLSCLLIAFGGCMLIRYYREYRDSRNTSQELKQIYDETAAPEETVLPTPSPAAETEAPAVETPSAETESAILPAVPYPDNPYQLISDRFRKLRKKSEYIVGWISMDDVEEAVAKKDNTYFLNHDATGKRNSNGAIFMDAAVNLRTRPYTVILYGHNMKSGNMFGRLRKYRDSSYLSAHRIITFDTMYEEGQYTVFAAMEFSTLPGTSTWFDLWSLDTSSWEDRETAIRALESRSIPASLLDVQADDQILLLVTCLDGDDERFVVAARRLRENETADSLDFRKQ